MKQLTTTAGRFGPFASVETLSDRYRCDNTDLPFAVIGQGAIADWEGPLPDPPTPAPTVPTSVTMRQASLALLAADLLDDVEALVATLPRAYQIEWQRASTVERTNPLVEIVREQKGLTSQQIDDLFISAAAL